MTSEQPREHRAELSCPIRVWKKGFLHPTPEYRRVMQEVGKALRAGAQVQMETRIIWARSPAQTPAEDKSTHPGYDPPVHKGGPHVYKSPYTRRQPYDELTVRIKWP